MNLPTEKSPISASWGPGKLRYFFLRVWDSDRGGNTLRTDLWFFFQSACELELKRLGVTDERRLSAIRTAWMHVWANQSQIYKKPLWRDLDDALRDAFGSQSGWN